MSKEMSKEEATVWSLVGAIRDSIREAGEKGIPSGHLYAMLIGKMSLDTYQSIIDMLKKAGSITQSGHVLKAV